MFGGRAEILAHVALPVPLEGPFTYRVSEALARQIVPGVRVLVPFGTRQLTGVVTAIPAEAPPDLARDEIRDVERVIDAAPILSEELLKLARWVADYYLAPEGEVLRSMLPLGAEMETRRVVRLTAAGANFVAPFVEALKRRPLAEAALRRRFGLTEADLRKLERQGILESVSETRDREERENSVVALPEEPATEPPTGKREQRVVQMLVSAGGPLPLRVLAAQAQVPPQFVRKMLSRGLLARVAPAAVAREIAVRPSDHTLNPAQLGAIASIRAHLDAHEFAAVLLHGVTGSGKTEVYLDCIAQVVRGGGTALMLVPEIALTPAMAEQFQARFGESVAILHSAFPGRERSREWRRVRAGDARVVIGTRSAVFAPVDSPRIIIVDEEHDHSYKQEETPRYNGRDVALVRARAAAAVAVLGSATPSMESRHNAAQGKYEFIELGERVEGRPLPRVQVVDMRQEFISRKQVGLFSHALTESVSERLARKEQVILLLNRRGYASVMLCRGCGTAAQCVNCSISLTYHRREQRLLCHYCGYYTSVPGKCPQCNSEHLYFLGQGSEKIEELVGRQFEGARVVRLDRDTARGKQQYENILGDFKRGQYDILVGTQMIAKGHDIHQVTLVGVISADIALGLPDFRAAERTFQLLTQVAGRAGRGELLGDVIIQTYFPDHYAIRAAAAQDYGSFFQKELRFRRAMHYPPFTALANILLRSARAELALKWSGSLSRRLAERAWPGVRILGPAAAPLARLKQEFRYQFLVKSEKRSTLHELLRDCRSFAREQDLPPTAMIVDVDPYSLL